MSNGNFEEVLFISDVKLEPGEAEAHAGAKKSVIANKLENLREDWQRITFQLNQMISNTNEDLDQSEGYKVDEIEVSLAFTAKGKLAFIAEAGTEASIKVLFKKHV